MSKGTTDNLTNSVLIGSNTLNSLSGRGDLKQTRSVSRGRPNTASNNLI